ncbi:hypothetical protein X734_28725 [Mesorhizobium sp. L2C084A000]|nr:hypothetical protein X734_28725 [Mesorhizobium sp. L2C084A000]
MVTATRVPLPGSIRKVFRAESGSVSTPPGDIFELRFLTVMMGIASLLLLLYEY